MTSFGTGPTGKLMELDAVWKRDYKEHNTTASEVQETVQQKRKRLFNKDTGSLNLSFKGIPFWIEDPLLHQVKWEHTNGFCCFMHIVGLPINRKTGEPNPLFPYQMELLHAMFDPYYANPLKLLQVLKHIWIKKATGVGFSDLVLDVLTYLPLAFPEEFIDSQMAIVTGINMTTAKRLMRRIRKLLYQNLKLVFDSNETVIDINGCIIECFPATHPDSYRSLDNCKALLYDEADFGPIGMLEEIRDAIERYAGKSNPWIIVGSTANEPENFMETIEKQSNEECFYKRLFWLLDKARGYMFSEQDVLRAQASDSFAREYLGEYRGLKGNLFSKEVLEYAAGLTDRLEIIDKNTGILRRVITREPGELSIHDVITNPQYLGVAYRTSHGCDPAWNSSMFAFVTWKKIGDIIYAVHEKEINSPIMEEATEEAKTLMYDDYPSYNPKIYVDASGIPFIRALKKEVHEDDRYHNIPEKERYELIESPSGMIVCPIPFNKFGDRMNYHMRRLYELGVLRVSPEVTPHLYLSCQTARYDEKKNRFDKQATSKNDTFDAGRLGLVNFKIGDIGVLTV